MPVPHLLLALLVAVVWGVNFIFVKLSLDEMSPLLLCALRFILASIPAIFFIPRPAIPFRIVVLYGLIMFALQFALLFIGMAVGMTPGMASLIMQMQVFFSMFFAVLFLGEELHRWQISGALVSFMGIGLVALHLDKNVSLLGFVCLLSGAATWGVGNLIIKKLSKVNMMSLVVWGCFVSCIPMTLLSFVVEGPARIAESYHHLTWVGISSLFYIVYISTWVGYGVWNWLLSRYPVSVIVPFTLLVPVVGVMSSIFILGESFQLWKAAAGVLVILGLYINIFGARLFRASAPQEVAG